MTNPPMDWYPDPADSARERYWDGTQWTHNTRPARAVAQPGAGQQPAPVVDPAAPGQAGEARWGAQVDPRFQPQGGPQQQQWSQGVAPGYAYPVSVPGRTMTRDGVPTAGWWQRFFAYLVDTILLAVLNTLLGWHWVKQVVHAFSRFFADVQASAQAGGTPPSGAEMMDQYGLTTPLMWMSAIGALVTLVYFTTMWALRGQTLGMGMVGIRVVPTDQGTAPRPLGWSRALRRQLVVLALGLVQNIPTVGTALGLLALANYLMPLWTDKKQCLHDMAAGTQVVRTR